MKRENLCGSVSRKLGKGVVHVTDHEEEQKESSYLYIDIASDHWMRPTRYVYRISRWYWKGVELEI
jgi:hypothetical protein